MESVIKWQTGTPKYNDKYIVTYRHLGSCGNRIGVAEWCGKHWYVGTSVMTPQVDVIAWCPLNEIETYKNK